MVVNDKPQFQDQDTSIGDQPDRDQITAAQPSDELIDQAIAWHVKAGIDDRASPVYAAYQDWCAQNPAHQKAADKVSAFMADDGLNDVLSRMEAELASSTAEDADQPGLVSAPNGDRSADASGPHRGLRHPYRKSRPMSQTSARPVGRRRAGGLIGMLAAACCVVVLAVVGVEVFAPAPNGQQLVATRDIVDETLPDGSQLTLAPGTALTWSLTNSERRIDLEEGAVTIKAAHDTARPLVVHSGISDVTVVGTRFIVISDQDSNEVGVAEGIVRVRERQTGQHSEVTLTAGQGLVVDPSGKFVRRDVTEAQIDNVAKGWRVFSPKSLGDVAAAIRRQSGVNLLIDPSIAGLDVRGRFNLVDGEQSIGLLVQSLGLNRYDLPFGYVLLTSRG